MTWLVAMDSNEVSIALESMVFHVANGEQIGHRTRTREDALSHRTVKVDTSYVTKMEQNFKSTST